MTRKHIQLIVAHAENSRMQLLEYREDLEIFQYQLTSPSYPLRVWLRQSSETADNHVVVMINLRVA